MMKRILSFGVIAALALSLAACGAASSPAASDSTSTPAPNEASSVSVPASADHGDGPAVAAEYPPEDIPEEMIVFREEPTDYDQPILLRAQTDVKNLQFFIVDYPEDDGLETEGEALFTCEDVKAGDEMVLITSFPGEMPVRGISFDLDGQHEAYALSMSGKDGSLILTPMGGVIAGW